MDAVGNPEQVTISSCTIGSRETGGKALLDALTGGCTLFCACNLNRNNDDLIVRCLTDVRSCIAIYSDSIFAASAADGTCCIEGLDAVAGLVARKLIIFASSCC